MRIHFFSLHNRLQRRSLEHSQVTELRVSAHQPVSGVVQPEPLQQQSLLLLIWKDETRDCFKAAARVEGQPTGGARPPTFLAAPQVPLQLHPLPLHLLQAPVQVPHLHQEALGGNAGVCLHLQR